MFQVGQKVVCVDDAPHSGLSWLCEPLRRGEIYTVRETGISCPHGFGPCIRIDERGPRSNGIDTPFLVRRFRPVVERKTDISIFTAMLSPTPAKEIEKAAL